MDIVIGSRASALAVVQAELVCGHLRAAGHAVRLETFTTTGDRILDRRLDQVGGKGLFVKELDEALRAGACDFTVHSCKDLPMEVPDDLPLVCFSAREDPRDVLVFPAGRGEPDFSLPIGTSSRRRELQLARLFPQARFESVRGNVQTRLRKLDEGGFGAIVLAAAGLVRLGLADRIGRYLEPDEVIPAAGQGILAVQGRAGAAADSGGVGAAFASGRWPKPTSSGNSPLPRSPESASLAGRGDAAPSCAGGGGVAALFAGFASDGAAVCARAERAFVARLDGGCSSPIAAHAQVEGDTVTLRGLYYDEEAASGWRGAASGSVRDAEAIARGLADRLRAGDGERL